MEEHDYPVDYAYDRRESIEQVADSCLYELNEWRQ